MKQFTEPMINAIRATHPTMGYGDADGGYFVVGSLRIIASRGMGWDHVSVSLGDRTPTWQEMCYVKDLFFYPEECVVQYHPPKSQYVNNHDYVLHLWRPQSQEVPMPPRSFV